jgi:hypothetical protein
MPIIGLQIKLQERGRIRIGKQVETKRGGKAPKALDKFRLTSRDEKAIIAAAQVFGGKVVTWQNQGRTEYEVETTSDRLPVLIPPSELGFSQWNELWSAGGCQRRCDEEREQISDGPCLCDPSSRVCEPHTRLSVMLPDIPGFGLWRLDTQGYYAATELLGAVKTLQLLSVDGRIIPGALRLDQRSIKHPDEPIKRFVVPMLDFDITPLMGAVTGVEPPKRRVLTPVPDKEPPPNIAEQMASVEKIESNRRRAAEVKPTGIAPRTAAEAAVGNVSGADAGLRSLPETRPLPEAHQPHELRAAGIGRSGRSDISERMEDATLPLAEEDVVQQTIDRAHAVAQQISKITETQGSFPESVPQDPWTNEPPQDDQGLFSAEETTGNVLPISKQQLAVIGNLFNKIGLEQGDQPRLDWCIKQLGRTLQSPTELSQEEGIILVVRLTREEQHVRIRRCYPDDASMLDDLTQAMQRDTRLDSLESLTPNEVAEIIERIEQRGVV